MAKKDTKTSVAPTEQLTAQQQARRKLLAMTAYVAPAVLGTLLVGKRASAAPPSCGPAGCNPSKCGPLKCSPGR
jgi:hypothetical protein